MSKTLTGLRYRLEPNPGHERILARSAGACRWLWNWALAYRQDVWLAARSAGATGPAISLGYNHLSSLLPNLKKEAPWLTQAPHHALQHALRNLDRAFSRFFAGTAGHPRFKSRGDRDAIRFPDRKEIEVEGDWLKLPKLGWIRFRLSRPISCRIRNATVSREGRAWFVSLCVEGNFALPNADMVPVGVDLGVVHSVVHSTGLALDFPVATRKEESRLRWLARQASKRIAGSHRRRRTLERLAKLKRHIANRRRDAAHKLSTKLASTHSLIAIEDLRVQPMTASAKGTLDNPGHHVRAKASLNRAMLANGHSDFRRMLAYKCERSGAQLVAVPPAYTSQTCSFCRYLSPESRKSQADFQCVACGINLNADFNAAVNILAAGLAVSARGGSGLIPAGEPRTHPGVRRKPAGPTGIPVRAASAAGREEVKTPTATGAMDSS